MLRESVYRDASLRGSGRKICQRVTHLQAREELAIEGYDIVGDVHGHADKLEGLLREMGYSPRRRGYRLMATSCQKEITQRSFISLRWFSDVCQSVETLQLGKRISAVGATLPVSYSYWKAVAPIPGQVNGAELPKRCK